MEALDIEGRVLELLYEDRIYLLVCIIDLIPGDLNSLQFDLVELLSELDECLVPVLAHLVDDTGNDIGHVLGCGYPVLLPESFFQLLPHTHSMFQSLFILLDGRYRNPTRVRTRLYIILAP